MGWLIVSVIRGRWSGGSSSGGITRTSRCASINVHARGSSESKALLLGPVTFIFTSGSLKLATFFIVYWKGVTTCEFNVGLIILIVATVSVVGQVIDDSTEIVWMMGFLSGS